MKIQKNYDVNTPILVNAHYASLIEYWTNGGDWETLIKGLDIGEGDIVRTFKRTIDLLRQITIIPNIPRIPCPNSIRCNGLHKQRSYFRRNVAL